MIPSVADIRASGDGYADFSDYEVLQAAYPAYQRYYPDFTEFAKAAGTNPGGLTGNRLGAGVDNYQAGLYGVGEAVAGAVGADSAAGWLGQRRVSNESQARGQTQFARDQGAVESFREVDGVGSGLNYLGGLAAQSLPYLGEAVVGGMVARGLMSGTRAALTGAKTVEEAAAATRALNMGSSAGAVAASYPSAVGDILQNQREEAGTTDLGSAMVGGVPYAALNAIGVEGMAARGLRGIGGTGTSRLRNAAYEGGKSLLAEGASETGQELVNQSFGRMAVNPDQTLFNPEANERYLESFVGGAALGGVAGGVSGLRQRPKPTVEEQPNLLDRATDRPDFDLQSYGQGEGPLQGAPVVGEDFGSLNSDLGEAIAMAEAAQKSGDTAGLEFANKAILQLSAQVRALEPTRVQGGQRTLMSGVHEMVSGQPIELTNDELGQGTMPFVPPGVDTGLGLSLGGAPVQQGMDFEYQDINPLQEGVGNSPGQNAPVQSPQAVAVKAVAEKAAQARKAALTDLVDMTPDGQPAVKVNPRALQAHTQMSELRDAGVMTQAALEESLGTLREAIAAEDTKTINAVAKQAQENYSAFKNPQPAAAQAPAVVSRGNAPAVGAASQTVAGIGPNQTTTVGRKGRAKQVTAGQLLDMFANATPREAATLRLATGLESDTDPTTGKPIMLPTGENPLSNPEIATKLQELGFGVIGSAGVQATLTKFNVTPAVVDAVNATSVDAVSEAELGLDQAGGTETAGLRVEDTMSKATGQGLVEGGNENREQRRSRAGADIILRDGGVSEKVAEMFPGERAQAPQAVAVPDPKQAVTDLREGNAAVVAQNVQRILATQEYQLAAADWFGQQYTIDQLPDTLKADWFEIYSDTLDKYDQEWNADVESELTAAAQSIERDADILTGGPQTAQLGQATGVEVEPVGGNESAAGGAQSTEGRTAPTVKVKKKRTVVRDATDVTAKPEQTTENGQTVAGEKAEEITSSVVQAPKLATPTNYSGKPSATIGSSSRAVAGPGFGPSDVLAKKAAEAPQWAQGHAKETGGLVVYHNGDVALVTGYSVLTGQVVYAAAHVTKGRTRVDVSSYTGAALTPEQRAELVAAKDRLVAEQNALQQKHPEGPFSGGKRVAATPGISAEALGFLEGLLSTLGLKNSVRVLLVDPASARTDIDKLKLYGRFSSALSAGLDANESGSFRKLGDIAGDFYISLKPGIPADQQVEVIAHEVGHLVERVALEKADAATKVAIKAEYHAWLESRKGLTAPDQIRALRNRAVAEAQAAGVSDTTKLSPYWSSFSEWFADNTSRWATTSAKPLTLVDKFFKGVAETLSKLAAAVMGRKYLPAPSVAKFLDAMSSGTSGLTAADLQDASGDFRASQNAGPIAQPDYTPKLKLSTKLEKFAHKHMGMTVAKMVRDAATLAANGARSMQFLGDIVDTHKARMPALKAWYDKFNDIQAMRRELEESAETIVAMTSKLKSTKRLSDFIAASTLSQKWGYDPVKVHGVKAGEGQVVDASMRVEFNKLWPEEKAVVQAVFQHGIDTVNKRDEIMRALNIDTSVFSPTGRLVGPYAPLKRFGDHVAVLKSKELLAAETAGDTQRVETLKESPDHYMVSSFDTAGQAYEFTYQNDAANGGTFAFTDNFAQKERVDSVRSMPEKVLQKVMGHIDTNKALDAKGMEGAKEAVQKLVRDMYANAIEEKSARAAGLKRLNRAGFESDMLRSFLANARANASFLANMRHGAEANAEFYKFQQESRNADTGKHDMMDVVNTVTQHYQKSMEYKDTPVRNFVLAMTSVMQLALSPAYHIANATQPLMVTAPKLAADFSDYSGAVRHLKDGYNLLKTTGVWGQLNLKGVKDAGLRGALERASRAGLLDVGMDEDMSHLERFTTGYKAADTATSTVQKTIHKLRQISRSVEAANRVSTAYAAYTMHLANNTGTSLSAAEKVEQAQEYASKVLRETQGDFSMNGAPLLLKKLPRLVTQYRKYQFMMGAVYVKAFQQAFAGSSPTEKALGRRMLGYMLGHAAVAGGALGLPLVNVVGMVFAALGDPDEPKDLERTLREAIGDETMANALLHGPLSWLGLDGKLSQANIFAVMPYTDVDMSSKSGIATTVMGLAGPSFAQVTKMALGVGKMAEGDYVKGVEGVMPSGISNAIKAFRIANEGYTMSNGDVMFKPEDINGLEMFLDGLGLRSNEMKRMQWLRGQQYEIDRFFKERTGEVTKAYVRAIKDGDMEAAAEARDDWSTLQANKDGLRKYFGDSHAALKRQPLSTLLKAPQEQKRREAKLQATVPQ